MSEPIKLVVQEPVMVKRGHKDNGQVWERWKFKATCADGRLHTINTFWTPVGDMAGKEIVGTITEKQMAMPDGTPYTSRTFVPDAEWDTARKASGETPIQAPTHRVSPAAIKTGTQVLHEQSTPTRQEMILWARDQAGRGVNCLVQAGVIKDTDTYNLAFETMLGGLVDALHASYIHPDIFAPNNTPQVRSTAPDQRVAAAKAKMEAEMEADEVDA